MRSDSSLSSEVCESQNWKNQFNENGRLYELYEKQSNGKVLGHSHSGNERNHLFINDQNGLFLDRSVYSGIDSICDSRTNVVWDFDGDGWQDLAVVNANYPHLQIFHNQMSKLDSLKQNKTVAIRLVGGNETDQPSTDWSNRDGVGARIMLKGKSLPEIVRQLQVGEGFAAQNSATKIVGIGQQASVDLTVAWPSGKVSQLKNIEAGSLVTCYENANLNKGDEFMVAKYNDPTFSWKPNKQEKAGFTALQLPESKTKFNLLLSTATWCSACKRQYPQLERLQERFGDELAIFAVAMDAEETTEQWDAYIAKNEPPFQLLTEIQQPEREAFKELIMEQTGSSAMPASVVVDSEGNVLYCDLGVPTLSELFRALE